MLATLAFGADLRADSMPDQTVARDVDGHAYQIIEVGGQRWFAENLRVSRAEDGTALLTFAPNAESANVQRYGFLYSWQSANLACPQGYHLPTDEEWSAFELAVSADHGLQLGNPTVWRLPVAGHADVESFAALPAGYANDAGLDNLFGQRAVFWSATADGDEFAWARSMRMDAAQLERASQHPHYGFSVRCVAN